MGQFKPMVKMFTDEPKVILKLKKGGKVKVPAFGGHSSMSSTNAKHMDAFESESGKSPSKPSVAARRKAMNPNLYKKGGKVAHKQLGGGMPMAAANPAAAKVALAKQALVKQALAKQALAKRAMAARAAGAAPAPVMKKGGSASCAKVEKELKHHEAMSAKRAHGKASGGAIDAAETRTTLKNSTKPYAKTKMHDGDKHDSAGGTGKVKMGAAGYKTGGTIKGNVGKFAKTAMHDGDKHDSAGGTGKVRMGVAGYAKGGDARFDYSKSGMYGNQSLASRYQGYQNTPQGMAASAAASRAMEPIMRFMPKAKGGSVSKGVGRAIEGNEGKFTNNNINDGDKHDSAQGTGGVKRGAGGYKKGGRASKKAFATGGQVIDDGRAVEMPRRRVSPPVANTTQAGTFKHGGKVSRMHDEGSEMHEAMPSAVRGLFDKAKDLFSHGLGSPKGKGHHVIHEVVTTTIIPKKMKGR